VPTSTENKNAVPEGATTASDQDPCHAAYSQIEGEKTCETKWTLFQQHLAACENTVFQTAENDGNSLIYKDELFPIAECFLNDKKSEKAIEVYKAGLQLATWTIEDPMNSFPSQYYIKRALEPLLPSENKKCQTLDSFSEVIQQFTTSHNPEFLKELIYSENTLDHAVMGSDAGGPLSFSDWAEYTSKRPHLSEIQFGGKFGSHCFLTTGWNEQFYPWQVFCADKKGDNGCYYLFHIYEGVESTLDELKKEQN
jgi:hypothetical protein